MKIQFILLLLLLSACAIEEIPRQPLLSPPLGLAVQLAPATGSTSTPPKNGIALYFTANNNEIYFSGFLIYVSTQKQDFQEETNVIIPTLNPTNKPNSKAQLLKNKKPTDSTFSIYVGGQMVFPNLFTYPEDAQRSPDFLEKPSFTLTSFAELPDGTSFVEDTTYYFVVYSYSSVDDAISLPSNIVEIKYKKSTTP